MPWICRICNKIPADQPLQALPGAGPRCYETQKCKNAGVYATVWQEPEHNDQPVDIMTDEVGANFLGYPTRVNSHTHTFPNKHKTGVIYGNLAGSRGISPDGSTHAGDRSSWKCFTRAGNAWTYIGTFQSDLSAWPFRIVVGYETGFARG